MGIKFETLDKVKNMLPLTKEEKIEMLKDTQRTGFSPLIHEVRATFDLTEVIEKLDTNSTKLSKKIFWYTVVLTVLTLIMTIATLILLFK